MVAGIRGWGTCAWTNTWWRWVVTLRYSSGIRWCWWVGREKSRSPLTNWRRLRAPGESREHKNLVRGDEILGNCRRMAFGKRPFPLRLQMALTELVASN